MTKGGVYYDLDESNFCYGYKIGDDTIYFTFSSVSHLNKFEKQVDEYVEIFNDIMKRKFGVDPNMMGYPAILLYSKIETRGFKMYWHGEFRSLLMVENLIKEGVLNG